MLYIIFIISHMGFIMHRIHYFQIPAFVLHSCVYNFRKTTEPLYTLWNNEISPRFQPTCHRFPFFAGGLKNTGIFDTISSVVTHDYSTRS